MELTLDFETRDDHIKTLGAGWACSNDFKVIGCSVSVDGAPAYWTTKPQEVKDLVSKADVLIGHNAQYDFGILLAMGLDISKKTLIDTIIMCKLDYNQHQSYSLDAMAKVYLGAEESKQTDELAAVVDKHKLYKEKGKQKKCTDIKKLKSYARSHIWEIYKYEPEIVEMYCNQDVNLTQRLYRQLKSKMDPAWMYRASCVLQQCLYGRKAGVPVDIKQLKKTREAIALKELGCKMQLAQQLDMLVEDVELNSTKILPTYLDKLGIKYPLTEKGSPSVRAKWLEDHKHPFCQVLHKYRKYQKIRRDFCDKLLACQELMRPDKRGFVYPELTMFGANRTGRFSARMPNIQQIPARDKELGPLIRACYVARPGETWYSLDISQQEFRIFAHYAHVLKWDSLLYLEYKANPTKDFHNIVAEACQISRDDAKPINLGSLYGMGKKKMAVQLHKDEDETEDLLEQYHERLPAVKLGLRACSKILKERGFIKTLGGRRSYIDPPMFRENEKITFEYKGLNKVIQGSAGDQAYEALTLLWEKGIIALFSVHDELCLSTSNPKDAEIAADILSTCMLKMCNFTVPMVVDIGRGANWAEAKDEGKENK